MHLFAFPNTYMVLVYRDPAHLRCQLAGLVEQVYLTDRKVILCLPEPFSRGLAEEFGELVNRRLFFLVPEEYRAWYAGEPCLVRRNAEAIAWAALDEGRTGAVLGEVEGPPGEEGPYTTFSRPVKHKVIQAIAGLPLSVFCFCPADAFSLTGGKEADGPPDASGGGVLALGGVTLDRYRRLVTVNGRPVRLSPMESRLLWFLASHPGRVFSRRELLQAVWGYSYGDWTVAVHIHHLRKKIEPDPSHPVLIRTVRGVGYRFTPPEGPS